MLAEGINEIAATWLREGRRVVAATLVETEGSSPLSEGATMLVDDRGRIEGSVTGGCVEGALAQEAEQVLAGGPARLRTYGISDSSAADVGLMCGGTVHILVHPLDVGAGELYEHVVAALRKQAPVAIATLVDGDNAGAKLVRCQGQTWGSFGLGERLDRSVSRDSDGFLATGHSGLRSYGADGVVMGSEQRVFIQAFAMPAQMLIFGAIDFSAAVAAFARMMGYSVTICDVREPFVRGSRFAHADEIVVDWPDRFLEAREVGPRDVILVFTHDPKFDEPALVAALRTEAAYIGALGSRRTHRDRRKRLLDAGVEERDLERIAAPCGLDIGARTPEETAVSVLAEIISWSTGRSGASLSRTDGQIHGPPPEPEQV